MRYYRYVIYPEDGHLHPIEEDVMADADVEREAIVSINLHEGGDGTVVYRLRGEPEDPERVVGDHPDVIDTDLFDVRDGRFHVYVWFAAGDPATELLRIADRYGLIMDTPFRFTSDGGLEITVAGKNEHVQDSVPDLLEAVEGMDTELDQVGEYVPETDDLQLDLTERQKEILRVAVEEGYYEQPRETTHEEIGDVVGCSGSTVGEHLHRAEARIMPRVTR